MDWPAVHVPTVLIEGRPDANALVELDAATSHHLLRVRRIPREASIVVVDGQGHQATAVLATVLEGRATLRMVGPWIEQRPRAARHLVWAIPKGPALEAGLRMAVEAGVTEIHLALGRRSVARSNRAERWNRVIESACTQCGRTRRPALDPLWPDLATAAARVDDAVGRYVAVPEGPEVDPFPEGPRAIAIGPEGGFTPSELDGLLDRGWQPIGLGPFVLRSDTAVAVGIARLDR